MLRLLTLPLAEQTMPLIFPRWLARTGTDASRFLKRHGVQSPRFGELWRSYASLAGAENRQAFVRTIRTVIEPGGQSVSALDRLYLASHVPTLIVWGEDDPIIPVAHAHTAHDAIAGSRLEILPGVGHFPHAEAPDRFLDALTDFLDTTSPAGQVLASHRGRPFTWCQTRRVRARDLPDLGRRRSRRAVLVRAPRRPYMEYEASRDRPNVVVDGSPNAGTVLALTHWPGMAQPPGMGADLSAQMAFRFVRSGADPGADVVTNNHFDQDGLASMLAFVEPDRALAHEELLIDLAAAGDFGTYRFRDAARASMVISAYTDTERSPIAAELTGPYEQQCAVLYETMLAARDRSRARPVAVSRRSGPTRTPRCRRARPRSRAARSRSTSDRISTSRSCAIADDEPTADGPPVRRQRAHGCAPDGDPQRDVVPPAPGGARPPVHLHRPLRDLGAVPQPSPAPPCRPAPARRRAHRQRARRHHLERVRPVGADPRAHLLRRVRASTSISCSSS